MADLQGLLKDYILAPAHVGFVVHDLDAALAHAVSLYGLDEEAIRYEPADDVASPTRFAFFSVGGLEFEYIQPCDDHFKQLLFAAASGGGGINHVAWRVRDLAAALKALAEQGIVPGYVTPEGPVSIGQKRMVYLDPGTTGGQLIELIELSGSADG